MTLATRIKANQLKTIQFVIDYIHEHPREDLSLQALSRLTMRSAHHFHRMFKTIVQENLYDYIRRVRIDRAARRLIFNDAPLTDIAEECGFNSLSSFSRSFKQLRGITPSSFRERYHAASRQADSLAVERFRQRMADTGKAYPVHGLDRVIAWARRKVQETVVTHIPETEVIYYRHEGAVLDRINMPLVRLSDKLSREAARFAPASAGSRIAALTYDDPHITDHAKCRYEICMTLSEKPRRLPKGIGMKRIAGGKYALLSIAEIPTIASFLWELTVQEWLPRSGYYFDLSRPVMEIYEGSPDQDPYNRQVFDLYIPVKTHTYF